MIAALPTAQTLTVFVKGSPVTFQSNLTDDAALARCGAMREGSFGYDLWSKSDRGLSRTQWAWVHKLAIDADKPRPASVSADLSGVIDLFDKAAKVLKRPRIDLDVDGTPLTLSRCGAKSQYTGAVNVTNGGGFDNGTWYGRIERDGHLTPGRQLTDAIREALTKLAVDPAGIAAKHGHKTGFCCFCGKKLDTAESTAVGYGPVCAKKWQLPWGAKFVPVAAT